MELCLVLLKLQHLVLVNFHHSIYYCKFRFCINSLSFCLLDLFYLVFFSSTLSFIFLFISLLSYTSILAMRMRLSLVLSICAYYFSRHYFLSGIQLGTNLPFFFFIPYCVYPAWQGSSSFRLCSTHGINHIFPSTSCSWYPSQPKSNFRRDAHRRPEIFNNSHVDL